MTPEQERFRDVWMAEMWAAVPEWHQTKDERLAAAVRNETLARPPERSRGAA